VPLDAVVRFDRNPKKHDVGALVQSVRRYGFRDAPIFDGTLKALVAGHGRLKALEAMRAEGDAAPIGVTVDGGQWLVPIQMGVDAKSAAEAKAFLIDHNALTLSGGDFGPDGLLRLYERDGLGEMLREAAEAGELPVTFDAEDMDELLNGPKKVEEDDPSDLIDHAEELRKKWGVEPGQLWILGDHRLLCGDSTKAEDVALVMEEEKAALCLTDPPYGVDYVGKTKDALVVHNDGRNTLPDLLTSALTLAMGSTLPGACWYVTAPAGPQFHVFASTLLDLGVWRQTLVWAKQSLVMGHSDYHYQHEAIFYGWTPGAAHKAPPSRTQTTLWEFDRPTKSREHPTMKPVALFGKCVENSSTVGSLIYDPFLGSGTTLIAAEQLGRKCYGLEIDPKYCAVIIQRWADATGKEPRRA